MNPKPISKKQPQPQKVTQEEVNEYAIKHAVSYGKAYRTFSREGHDMTGIQAPRDSRKNPFQLPEGSVAQGHPPITNNPAPANPPTSPSGVSSPTALFLSSLAEEMAATGFIPKPSGPDRRDSPEEVKQALQREAALWKAIEDKVNNDHDPLSRRSPNQMQDVAITELNDRITAFRKFIEHFVPPGRHKSLAITALEDVSLRTEAGILQRKDANEPTALDPDSPAVTGYQNG